VNPAKAGVKIFRENPLSDTMPATLFVIFSFFQTPSEQKCHLLSDIMTFMT